MVDGLPLLAAVGRGLENGAQQDGVGPGEEAGDKVHVLGIVLVALHLIPNVLCPLVLDPDGPFVAQGLPAAVSLAVKHHLADIFAVRILIVRGHVGGQLGIGEAVLPIDPLLQCGKAVRRHGKACGVHAHVVVVGAAVGDVDALFDEPVLEEVEDKLRLALGLVSQMVDDAVPGGVGGDLEMLPIVLPERFHIGRLLVGHHVLKGHLEDHGDVHLDGVVHGVLHARDAHPVAARGDALAGQLLGIAAAHEPFHEGLVAGVPGPALLVLEKELHGFSEEDRVDPVVDADGQVDGDVDLVRRVQGQIAQMAGGVVVVLVGAGELPVAAVLQKHAGKVEDRLLIRQDARGHVPLIEVVEQVLQLAAGGTPVVGAGDHAEPVGPLDRLPKGLRRPGADAVVDVRHLLQIGGQLMVPLLPGDGFDLVPRPVDEGDDRLHHGDFGIVKLIMGLVVLGAAGLKLLQYAAPAYGQADPQIGREVMAVVDAGDDLIPVKDSLQLRIRVVGIPFFILGTQPLQEQKTLGAEGVQGVHIDGMLPEDGAIVFFPRLIAVDGAVGVVGLERIAPILHDEAVIVLVGAAGLGFFLRLGHLALSKQGDALIVGKGPVRIKFVIKLNLAHVRPLQLILTWMSTSLRASLSPSSTVLAKGLVPMKSSSAFSASRLELPRGLKLSSS